MCQQPNLVVLVINWNITNSLSSGAEVCCVEVTHTGWRAISSNAVVSLRWEALSPPS